MTARTEEPFQAPLKAPAGHMWFDGVCECGSKYDLQTWATHVELAEAADVLERYSDASNIAQRSIARRLHTEAGYLAGTLTASAERFAAEHPDAHCAQEDTAR